MMKKNILFYLFFCMCLYDSPLFGKIFKKVLGKPLLLEYPKDGMDYNRVFKEKSKYVPWVVFCDRNQNFTYKTQNMYSRFRVLFFKEYYYVVEETSKALHIIGSDVKLNKLLVDGKTIDYGWIEKDKMLLWNTALINPNNGIHKKGMMVNGISGAKRIRGINEKAFVYNHPNQSKICKEVNLYELLFILKKEGDAVFLSKNKFLTKETINNDVIGWVYDDRIMEWNTRIALEPNFVVKAFNERKNNPKFQVKAFINSITTDYYTDGFSISDSDVLWAGDPVTLSYEELASENPHRYKGDFLRFPLLHDSGNYYRTGIILETTKKNLINDETVSNYVPSIARKESREIKSLLLEKEKINVLFVIDATSEMQFCIPPILASINEFEVDIHKVGASIYRDFPEKDGEGYFEIQRLSSNFSETDFFLSKVEQNLST